MPKLAAFPKGFIKQLVAGQMSIYEWIKLADELRVDGLEFYNNFADVKDPANWPKIRKAVEEMPVRSIASFDLKRKAASCPAGGSPWPAAVSSA